MHEPCYYCRNVEHGLYAYQDDYKGLCHDEPFDSDRCPARPAIPFVSLAGWHGSLPVGIDAKIWAFLCIELCKGATSFGVVTNRNHACIQSLYFETKWIS